jgi:hypothetical protein
MGDVMKSSIFVGTRTEVTRLAQQSARRWIDQGYMVASDLDTVRADGTVEKTVEYMRLETG